MILMTNSGSDLLMMVRKCCLFGFGFEPAFTPLALLRHRQTSYPRRFTQSRILNG